MQAAVTDMLRNHASIVVVVGALLAAPAALAGSANEPEISDPAGDAGPAGVPLGASAADFDIRAAWFETDEDGTWVALQLTSFDVHPPDVLFGVYAPIGDGWIGVGYATFLFPFPPFVVEGYGGCHAPTQDAEPECGQLEGELLPDGNGFRLLLPQEWVAAGAEFGESYAIVMAFPMAPVPIDDERVWTLAGPAFGAMVLDAAGPGRTYVVPDLADHDGGDVAVVSVASTSAEGASRTVAVGAGVAAIAALGAGALAFARRRA